MRKIALSFSRLLPVSGILLAAWMVGCTSQPPVPVPTAVPGEDDTPIPSQAVSATPVLPSPTPTSGPPPRMLTVCLGEEPDSLFPFSDPSPVKNTIWQAIYDGPVDPLSFGYQPVLLAALPDFANGLAQIKAVPVQAGERVLDAYGVVGPLEPGTLVLPAGCRELACAVGFDPDVPLQMDQLKAVFQLLPGIRWADGEPLTAQDSVYAYELARMIKPAAFSQQVDRTAAYGAVDSQTTEWRGVPGWLDPEAAARFWSPLPEHIWSSQPAELPTLEISARTPLGWGAYMIQSWKPGLLTLVRNPYYFRAVDTPSGGSLPAFDQLQFKFIAPGTTDSLALIQSGQCDIVDESAIDPAERVAFFEAAEAGEVLLATSTGTTWEHLDFGIVPAAYDDGLQFADRPAYFSDVRTRQGIAYCLDRAGLNEAQYSGFTLAPETFISPAHPLYPDGLAAYPYDPDKGSELLEAAGWLDADNDPVTPRTYGGTEPGIRQGTPFQVKYLTSTASQRQAAAARLVENLAGCGITAELVVEPYDTLTMPGPGGALFGRQFDLAQFSWQNGAQPPCELYMSETIPGPDARTQLFGWGGWNITGYQNAEFDQACQIARRLLPGEPGYVEAYQQTLALFNQELPAIPLYMNIRWVAARPDFCGLQLDPTALSSLWNLEALDYGDCP